MVALATLQRTKESKACPGNRMSMNVATAHMLLTRSRDIVGVALGRLRENETIFLHAVGVDIECDEARASLAGRPA